MTNNTKITPKRQRKLKVSYIIITLLLVVAAAFLLFRFSLKSSLQSKLDAIRADGYPATCAELNAWYTIPEFSENAADTMIEAFSHYYEWDDQYLEELPIVGRAELPGRTEPIAEETKTLIEEYLTDNKKALELLHKGAAMEHSRYPVDFTQGLAAFIMPYLADIRKGARRLELETVLHAENDEPQMAANSVITIFGVARSFVKEPIIVSQLVRISWETLGVSALERVLNRTELTDKQLVEIGEIIVNAEDSIGMSRAFAGERCIMGDFLRDPTSQDISLFIDNRPPSLSTPLISLYKVAGLADTDALLYLDIMTDYMEALQLPVHERKRAAEAVEAGLSEISKIHVFLHLTMPAFAGCVSLDLRCFAQLQAARTALAVQRYRLATGSLPRALSDIVPIYLDFIPKDPFDGKNLRYRKLEAGFVVYSVGEDGQDDGGKERPPYSERKNKPCTYDITFIIQR